VKLFSLFIAAALLSVLAACKSSTQAKLKDSESSGGSYACQEKKAALDELTAQLAALPDASTAEGRSKLDRECSAAGASWRTGSTDVNNGCFCTNVAGAAAIAYPYNDANYKAACSQSAPDASTAEGRSKLNSECSAAGASWTTGATDANRGCTCNNVAGSPSIPYPYEKNYDAACGTFNKSPSTAGAPDASTPDGRSKLNSECSAAGASWATGSTDANRGCTCNNVAGSPAIPYPYEKNYDAACAAFNRSPSAPDASTADARSKLNSECSAAGASWKTGSTDANNGCFCTNVDGAPAIPYPYEKNYDGACAAYNRGSSSNQNVNGEDPPGGFALYDGKPRDRASLQAAIAKAQAELDQCQKAASTNVAPPPHEAGAKTFEAACTQAGGWTLNNEKCLCDDRTTISSQSALRPGLCTMPSVQTVCAATKGNYDGNGGCACGGTTRFDVSAIPHTTCTDKTYGAVVQTTTSAPTVTQPQAGCRIRDLSQNNTLFCAAVVNNEAMIWTMSHCTTVVDGNYRLCTKSDCNTPAPSGTASDVVRAAAQARGVTCSY
jgi:hypothetical protein